MARLRTRIKLVPLADVEEFRNLLFVHDESLTLRQFLARSPALSTEAIAEADMDQRLDDLSVQGVAAGTSTPLYRPPGMVIVPNPQDNGAVSAPNRSGAADQTDRVAVAPRAEVATQGDDGHPPAPRCTGEPCHPTAISEKEAVGLAYARDR